MTRTPHPYPAYKPSGVAWLDDVPAHWDLVPNRVLMNLKKDLVGNRASNYTLLSLTKQGVIPRNLEHPVGKFPSSFDTYQVVESGDLIFCLFDIDETPRTVGLSHLNGMVTGAYTRFICGDRNLREYLFLLYLSLDDRKLLKPLYSGLRKVIPRTTFLNVKVALPSEKEQTAIVRYLDHADRRIRRYVSAKRKLIALLEEEKQAVINQAVTRGLDPNVRLKPSGVEWLGDVPEHWEVRRLGYLATKFGSGVTPRGGATVYQEDGVPLLRSQNIHFEGLRIQKVARIAPELHQELSGSHVRPGDVLLNITGASIGRVCSVPEGFTEGNVNQHVCIIRPIHGRLLPNLLAAYLSTPAMQRGIQLEQSGASREGLTLHSIRNFKVVVPPLPEQRVIVEHLDKAIGDIKAAIARVHRQIELAQEYRTCLIADVVTGKLDVREAAAQLPDEGGDREPIHEDDPSVDDADGGASDAGDAAEKMAMESEVTV